MEGTLAWQLKIIDIIAQAALHTNIILAKHNDHTSMTTIQHVGNFSLTSDYSKILWTNKQNIKQTKQTT